MTILYAEGFELGTTLAESNTFSGMPMVLNAYVNTSTSVFNYAAASNGKGRSLGLTVFGNSTTPANGAAIYTTVTGFTGNTAAVGYTFSLGFRAKLNPNRAAIGTSTGLSNNAGSANAFVFNSYTTQATSATFNVLFGANVNIGTVTIPDLNSHYYTLTATKIGTTTWTVNVWMDKTNLLSVASATATLTSDLLFYYCNSTGGTLTNQLNHFSEVDDVYIADGETAYGDIYIRNVPYASDVQAQWTKVGAGSTNYGSVNNISLTSGNSLTATATVTDIYGNASTTTTGKKIMAVRGCAVCVGSSGDTITESVKMGGTTISSAAVNLSGLDTLVSTGWNQTLNVTSLAALQVSMAKA